jgi:D-arabinose 1-dehydrogenase-like Zn-dependent alcohol dehydrogenase
LRILGSSQNRRQDLYDILQMASSGKVRPMIEEYGIEDLPRVVERLSQGKVRFRAVVNMQ